jgi:nucleotidyltransferase substrate binding protein (TIGR01987 family)
MSDSEAARALAALGRAIDRLREALAEPEGNPLAVDGTIQRFEFAIELSWKAIRRLLLREGVATSTPREALQEAFRAGWLADETAWLQMLRDRNETSHTYNETVARRIYANVRSSFPEMERTYRLLRDRFAAS